MRFAAPFWLFGSALSLVVAGVLAFGGFLLLRAVKRFGDEQLVLGLVTGRPGGRRAVKGGLLVTAIALAFVALSEPQYGRGTRLMPATNLDVVIVLDYSKSMYARDVTPSRTLRAKTEVARLIADLPGARFGGIAFAGQPMSFPLTSDGGAISQFFRQITPNDMPIGGTAIARALESARALFARDPLSSKHKKVILLVTDGEDLEGDPVAVAQAAAADAVTIHVVQVGGRTPEPLPEVNEAGQVTGWRQDRDGKPLTTELSAEGEEQLAKIAQATSGKIVRSAGGKTGIEVIAAELRKLMTEELSERVETVYADVFYYPLGLAALLLLCEVFVNETRRRDKPAVLPPPSPRKRRRGRHGGSAGATAGLVLSLLAAAACSRQRSSLFERDAPQVSQALDALDAGDAGAAVDLLQRYLSTGKCEKGEIGAPDSVRERPNASFDLGLGLFRIAEQYGQRFGAPPVLRDGGPTQEEQQLGEQRGDQVDCALRIVRLVASDSAQAPEFRARALYLAGNLEFLRGDYRTAVKSYDAALKVIPGLPPDAGDSIGNDAAHNRSIALRRIEEEEKRKPDAGPPDAGPPDAGPPDAGADSGRPDAGPEDAGAPDSGKPNSDGGAQQNPPDAGEDQDAGEDKNDAGQNNAADGGAPDAGAEPPSQPSKNDADQDESILEQLEQAPTVQQQDAKNRGLRGRGGRMEDK